MIELINQIKGFFHNLQIPYKYAWIDPRTWQRNYGTCLHWDKKLNELLDNREFSSDCYFEYFKLDFKADLTIRINGVSVWISNYPYSYGYDYGYDYGYHNEGHPKKLPKRSTVLRLRRTIQNEIDKTKVDYDELRKNHYS